MCPRPWTSLGRLPIASGTRGRVRVGQIGVILLERDHEERSFRGWVESTSDGGTGSVSRFFPPENATGNLSAGSMQRLPCAIDSARALRNYRIA